MFNTEQLSPLFERVIVASGTSNRQTKALASSVRETVKKRGLRVLSTEGEANGEWIIVDCGAAVAHIMQPAIRQYYRLEEIWGGKEVKLKLTEGKGLPKATAAGTGPHLSKARAPGEAAARKTAARRLAAPSSATKNLPTKRAQAKTAAAQQMPATNAPAKKASTRRSDAQPVTAKKAKSQSPSRPAARRRAGRSSSDA